MAVVRHRVGIRGALPAVFEALTQPEGLSKWWSTTASGTAAVGEALHLVFGGKVTLSFITVELDSGVSIHFECPNGPGPWNQSHLRFELEASGDQAFLTLTHWSDAASDDDFLYFNTKWPLYLLSLRDLIETGTGRPSPNDIPIFFGDNIHSNTT